MMNLDGLWVSEQAQLSRAAGVGAEAFALVACALVCVWLELSPPHTQLFCVYAHV